MAFKVRCFGGSSLRCGLRSGVWSSDPLLLRKEPGPVSFLLSKCMLPHLGWGLWRDCVSASLFHCVVFFLFTHSEGVVAQQIFGFLSEEPVPYVAADWVCLWEKVSSGSSFTATLNWNPGFILSWSISTVTSNPPAISKVLPLLCIWNCLPLFISTASTPFHLQGTSQTGHFPLGFVQRWESSSLSR